MWEKADAFQGLYNIFETGSGDTIIDSRSVLNTKNYTILSGEMHRGVRRKRWKQTFHSTLAEQLPTDDHD